MYMFSDVVVVVVLCFVGGVLFFLFRVSFFALLLLQNIQPKKVSFIILYDGCVPSFSVALYYSYNLKLTLNSKDLNFGKFFFKLKVSDKIDVRPPNAPDLDTLSFMQYWVSEVDEWECNWM